jgi:hypothetical protein
MKKLIVSSIFTFFVLFAQGQAYKKMKFNDLPKTSKTLIITSFAVKTLSVAGMTYSSRVQTRKLQGFDVAYDPRIIYNISRVAFVVSFTIDLKYLTL